jgi:hypothetical protein
MKIITFSGVDGSGKSSQLALLQKKLESTGTKAAYFHAVQFSLPQATKRLFQRETQHPGTTKAVTKSSHFGVLLRKISPGRLSLEVHRTAGHIEPAFAGQITLEMAVLAPLLIPPGWPICQVRFCEVTGEVEAYTTRGSYADAGAFDGPQTSRSYRHKPRHVRQTP